MSVPDLERMPCPSCGESIPARALVCRFCQTRLDGRPDPAQSDNTGGVIPYKNMPALIGYYLGVFSIIPCFPIGLAALVLGIKGLREVKRNPAVRGTAHAWVGILVGGFFGLVWTICTGVAILAAVAK